MARPKQGPLSPRMLKFAHEYILDPTDKEAAAIRAGYSKQTAYGQARRLMTDPRIKKLIEEAQDKVTENVLITKERIIQELATIAFSNPKNVVSEDADGDPAVFFRDVTYANAAGMEVTFGITTGSSKIKQVFIKTPKTPDKIAALKLIGQHMGMFKEQIDINANLTLEKLIEQSFSLPPPDQSNIIDSTATEVLPASEEPVEFIEEQVDSISSE